LSHRGRFGRRRLLLVVGLLSLSQPLDQTIKSVALPRAKATPELLRIVVGGLLLPPSAARGRGPAIFTEVSSAIAAASMRWLIPVAASKSY
jgi:hypothetical protein